MLNSIFAQIIFERGSWQLVFFRFKNRLFVLCQRVEINNNKLLQLVWHELNCKVIRKSPRKKLVHQNIPNQNPCKVTTISKIGSQLACDSIANQPEVHFGNSGYVILSNLNKTGPKIDPAKLSVWTIANIIFGILSYCTFGMWNLIMQITSVKDLLSCHR